MKTTIFLIIICVHINIDFSCGSVHTDIDKLLDAIEWVESRGDCNAVGDSGRAVGSFQIHKIYVDDCNRILKLQKKKQRYTYEDRWNQDKSRAITKLVLLHYGQGNIEKMARIHNGGPKGYKKKSTEKYWLRIKRRLESKK